MPALKAEVIKLSNNLLKVRLLCPLVLIFSSHYQKLENCQRRFDYNLISSPSVLEALTMSKDKNNKKNKSHYKGGRPDNKKIRREKATTSCVQSLTTSNGSDKLYNGGSPIQFNAAKSMIINVFKGDNTYRFVELPPEATAETIVETTFDDPEPTEAAYIDAPIAAELADHLHLHEVTIAAYEGLDLPDGELQRRIAEANIQLIAKNQATQHRRVVFQTQFDRKHEIWDKNRKEHEIHVTNVMKTFHKVFGALTMAQLRPLVDANRFRRAWFEVNAQNTKRNTSILLDELKSVVYDASIKNSLAKVECAYCGTTGHPEKFCRTKTRDEKKEEEDKTPQSSNGSVSIGSRFGNNKKKDAYSEKFVFVPDTTDVPYACHELSTPDHGTAQGTQNIRNRT